ncbi:hypothetical protein [Acinetobacter sp. Marseille-Q1618]|uniref:hypothetical protein n=1 Tax=Acinetobacter sp. Marseille-Q1618 TaxID=2697502 RepID=UPI00156E6CA1|nr:hypothetical protein [Acinetobacter sp. Marseille-Q1618]
MADQKRKVELIQRIEQFQLPCHLILALDDAEQAALVIEAVQCLEDMSAQWY